MKNILEKLSGVGVSEKNKPEEKIENSEIDRLEGPTEVILEKILDKIERGEYNLIIGADASGRVPTLIFKKFIDYLYQKLGYQKPKTIFLAGAGMGLKGATGSEKSFLEHKQGGAKEYIEKLGPKKVLIVEDTIVRGSSIHFMCEILENMVIPFDVVSITSYNDETEIEEVRRYLGAENVYVGTDKSGDIYGNRHLSGVIKDKTQVFSKPYKQEFASEDEKANIQKKINQARKDAEIVTGHIIDWYESRKAEDEK